MAGSEYYDHTSYPSTGASGSSSAMRAELELIESGFGKLPALAGNGNKVVTVNAGGTALEATQSLPTIGVAAGNAQQVDQAVTATTRSATTTLGTTLKHTLSDTSAAITAFNGVQGVTYRVRFLGAGVLTHHETDLIITQTGADITTEAGDTCDIYMLTATTCRVENYTRASGGALTYQAGTFAGLVTLAAGADIASAATIDLTAATGNSPRITGTVATSAVTMNTGQQMTVVADGAWPLTYHATTNKLNTGEDYTCKAGESIFYYKDLSGVVHGVITLTELDVSQTARTYTAGQRGEISAFTDGATITLDLAASNNFSGVLGGNRTLGNPTNIVAGQSGMISVWQDETGSRTLAYAWGWSWPGGTAGTLSTAKRTKDQLAYFVDVYATATVTITIATPGVVSWVAHGLKGGQKLHLTTTGALPTGLTASTTYYVIPVDADSFQLTATLGGTAIATSGTQSGVHTAVAMGITLSLIKAV